MQNNLSKMAERVPSGSSSPATDTDADFDPTADMLVHDYDDERTLDEEEAMSNDESVANELDDLQKEGDMPIEQLLAMYGYGANQQPTPATATDAVGGTGDAAAVGDVADCSSSSSTDEEEEMSVAAGPVAAAGGQGDAAGTDGSLSGKHATGVARLLRSDDIIGSSDDEDEDYDPDDENEYWKKNVQVGCDYQASVPQGLSAYGDGRVYENDDQLIWDPSPLSDRAVEQYVDEIRRHDLSIGQGVYSIPTGAHIKDDEQALYLLLQCDYDVTEAIKRNSTVAAPPADLMSLWSEEECRNFENGLRIYGKDFFQIQTNKVKTRSVQDLVQFYYFWKKTERHDAFAARTRLEKKKYTLHPGITDYMDRFLDEQDNPVSVDVVPILPGIEPDVFNAVYSSITSEGHLANRQTTSLALVADGAKASSDACLRQSGLEDIHSNTSAVCDAVTSSGNPTGDSCFQSRPVAACVGSKLSSESTDAQPVAVVCSESCGATMSNQPVIEACAEVCETSAAAADCALRSTGVEFTEAAPDAANGDLVAKSCSKVADQLSSVTSDTIPASAHQLNIADAAVVAAVAAEPVCALESLPLNIDTDTEMVSAEPVSAATSGSAIEATVEGSHLANVEESATEISTSSTVSTAEAVSVDSVHMSVVDNTVPGNGTVLSMEVDIEVDSGEMQPSCDSSTNTNTAAVTAAAATDSLSVAASLVTSHLPVAHSPNADKVVSSPGTIHRPLSSEIQTDPPTSTFGASVCQNLRSAASDICADSGLPFAAVSSSTQSIALPSSVIVEAMEVDVPMSDSGVIVEMVKEASQSMDDHNIVSCGNLPAVAISPSFVSCSTTSISVTSATLLDSEAVRASPAVSECSVTSVCLEHPCVSVYGRSSVVGNIISAGGDSVVTFDTPIGGTSVAESVIDCMSQSASVSTEVDLSVGATSVDSSSQWNLVTTEHSLVDTSHTIAKQLTTEPSQSLSDFHGSAATIIPTLVAQRDDASTISTVVVKEENTTAIASLVVLEDNDASDISSSLVVHGPPSLSNTTTGSTSLSNWPPQHHSDAVVANETSSSQSQLATSTTSAASSATMSLPCVACGPVLVEVGDSDKELMADTCSGAHSNVAMTSEAVILNHENTPPGPHHCASDLAIGITGHHSDIPASTNHVSAPNNGMQAVDIACVTGTLQDTDQHLNFASKSSPSNAVSTDVASSDTPPESSRLLFHTSSADDVFTAKPCTITADASEINSVSGNPANVVPTDVEFISISGSAHNDSCEVTQSFSKVSSDLHCSSLLS